MVANAPAMTPTFQPFKAMPIYRGICKEIEQLIVRGTLKEGMLLPTEQALCQQFGVNRSTIREAIRQLEQEGFVTRQGARRLYVSHPAVGELGSRTSRMLLLQQVTFKELWEVAMVLEPQAAALAALAATPEDIAMLESLLQSLIDQHCQGDSLSEHAELDAEFHAQVARASGNRVLILAREPINLLYRPTLIRLEEMLPQSQDRNIEAHRKLVKAIARHRPDEAAEWMRKHLVDFQRGYKISGIPMNTPLQASFAAD